MGEEPAKRRPQWLWGSSELAWDERCLWRRPPLVSPTPTTGRPCNNNNNNNNDDDDDDDSYMIIIMMIMMMIIAFTGANRDFIQSPHCAANCLHHVRSSGPGAIVCKSRATHRALITCNMPCYVPRGTKEQLSYLV